jgi:hypothetical protein
MPQIKIRAWTIVLIVLSIAFVAAGICYLVTPAHDLAAFVPGHEAHGTNHHIKHGIAMFGLAAIALVAAWFTTTPDRHADSA